MKKNEFRNCHNCDHSFQHDFRKSPCSKCLSHRGLTGWKPMSLRTRLRFLWRRIFW